MGEAANSKEAEVMENLRSAVFKESESLEGVYAKIEGYDFNQGVNRSQILKSLASTGFQASHLGDAIEIVNQMLEWRLSHEPVTEDCSEEKNPAYRESVKCKIFLGFGSDLISSGVREYIRILVQHRMVDMIVTTSRCIEEDIIKCLADTYKVNCIGNYRKLEDWLVPIFDKMLEEQKTERVVWTISRVIARLGKEINNESSYLYCAYKNNIPVFCPTLTCGSLRKTLHSYSVRNPGLPVDLFQDDTTLHDEALNAHPKKTGMIFLGGDPNMMCNHAYYEVFINTSEEFIGSNYGACPYEDVSLHEIHTSAKSIKRRLVLKNLR